MKNVSMLKNLFFQSITISFTRITMLVTPMLYIFAISNYDNSNLESYTLSTQFTQIALIIMVSMNIGTNIIFSLNKDCKNIYHYSMGGLFYISLIISAVFILISLVIFDSKINYINIVFLLSLPLSSLYLVYTSILEYNGKEKLSFNISLLSLAINIVFISLIIWLNIKALCGIVLLSVATKIYVLLHSAFSAKKHLNQIFKVKFDKKTIMEMFSYGAPEALTSLIFTTSIFLALYIMHYTLNMNVSIIGISLNYKNIISMFFIGYCISYTINFSGNVSLKLRKDIILSSLIFYFAISVALLVLLPLISFLYSQESQAIVSSYLFISTFIVITDSIGIFIVFHLRMNGIKKYPPLLRLSFAFIGTPLGILLAQSNNNDYHYLIGLLIGNSIFALLSILTYIKFVRKQDCFL